MIGSNVFPSMNRLKSIILQWDFFHLLPVNCPTAVSFIGFYFIKKIGQLLPANGNPDTHGSEFKLSSVPQPPTASID